MNFDIAIELARLHFLRGADFVRQLKLLAAQPDFHPVEGETGIFSMGGEQSEDYTSLLNAARKAVGLGYTVFILPNPKGIRTADFIFKQKDIYKMYDLKSISGKASVINRLMESVGMKNKSHLAVTFKWSRVDTGLLRSGFYPDSQDHVLTMQR